MDNQINNDNTVHKIFMFSFSVDIFPILWILKKKDRGFFRNIFFSDGANFRLGRHVDKQSCKIWGEENLQCWKSYFTTTGHSLVWFLG